MAKIDYRIEVLGVLLTKSSVRGGVKYSYRHLKLHGRAKKHPTGTGKITSHRKGKIESEYKKLDHKHSIMNKIYAIKKSNIKFNNLPQQGQDPMEYISSELGYTDYDIKRALGYFERLHDVKLLKTEHGYYTFRLFEGDKYVF